MSSSRLGPHKRIVVKIGSALLVDRETGGVRHQWLSTFIGDLIALRKAGKEVVIVSSGAIALGRTVLGLADGKLKLEESQAAAAVGQITLAETYAKLFEAETIKAGQVLLTLNDTEDRRRYLNARSTITTLLDLGVVPVINENDTVATTEIRYGDNDRLAARVASMISADCLILLSDVDGLYDRPPNQDGAQFIPMVDVIDHRIEAMAGDAGTGLSRGGMKTKIDAAKIATTSGVAMAIGRGTIDHPVKAIDDGGTATWFKPIATPKTAWKRWILGTLQPQGDVIVDDGAIKALQSGKSLLPAGLVSASGKFARGDAVKICSKDGSVVGFGLSGYDRQDAERLIGCHSRDIESILGYPGRAAVIHRDNLVLTEGESLV